MRISRQAPAEQDVLLVEVDRKNKKFQYYETTSEPLGLDFHYVGVRQWMYDGIRYASPEEVLEVIRRDLKGSAPQLKAGTYSADIESVVQRGDTVTLKLRSGKDIIIQRPS